MVAIAAQYRLSNQTTITPLEAMDDARAVIRWMRANAASLRIDSNRIAAFGWSAGGHLAASAAIFEDSSSQKEVSAVPNALILVSPAVDLEKDGWVKRLLGSRADISSISPVSHVRNGMPPTIILQGDVDTVTPLAGARLFHDRMRVAGNRCELHVFRGYGHLFTPSGIRDDEWPQPDPRIQDEAYKKVDEFLASHGFLK
jgi:acetyl esterase/lipase